MVSVCPLGGADERLDNSLGRQENPCCFREFGNGTWLTNILNSWASAIDHMQCTRFRLFVLSLMLLSSTVILAQPYQGPIIDAHGHLGGSFNWEIMVEAMDGNDVTQRTVMARYYPGPEGSRDLPGSDEDTLRLTER